MLKNNTFNILTNILSFIIISILFIGCGVAYYNDYQFADKSNGFSFDRLNCGYWFVPENKNEDKGKDLVRFNIRFSVYADESNCNSIHFYNLKIDSLIISKDTFKEKLTLYTKDRFRECNHIYYYRTVEIPNSIDSLYMSAFITYSDLEKINHIDTTVVLKHFEGHEFYVD